MFGIAVAIFGIEGIVELSRAHYAAAVWYFIPTVGLLLLNTQPTIVIRVPRPGEEDVTRSNLAGWSWRSQVGRAAFLTWVLILPMGYFLEHNLHHHHGIATVLVFAVPAVCSVGLISIARLRMGRNTSSSD